MTHYILDSSTCKTASAKFRSLNQSFVQRLTQKNQTMQVRHEAMFLGVFSSFFFYIIAHLSIRTTKKELTRKCSLCMVQILININA